MKSYQACDVPLQSSDGQVQVLYIDCPRLVSKCLATYIMQLYYAIIRGGEDRYIFEGSSHVRYAVYV